MVKEHRKYKRSPFREDILVDGIKQCLSMDICEGGVYISCIQPYETNSLIDISIPFKGEKITVKAQVQYSHPGLGMGVMFIDLNDDQRVKIKALIESIMS